MKIGFFDSGLGGLTILKAVRSHMPAYDYIYYGDTANLPYGDKTEGEIYELTKVALEYLFDHGAILVIIACNTASAETARTLQETILVGNYADRKILGVIIPTIEKLIECGSQRVHLIGTKRTIGSAKYELEINKSSEEIVLTSKATPELVPLIEAGEHEAAHHVLRGILTEVDSDIDTLILGCTHYTTIKEYARRHFAGTVISQDEIIPEKLKNYLEAHHEIENRLTREGSIEIVLSEKNARYEKNMNELFSM
jgi:glutamate racemase